MVDADDYARVLDELKQHGGATTLSLRKSLAQKAYARTAAYDAAISNWFASELGETDDVVLWDVGYLGFAEERQKMVLAHGVEFDVLDQHDLARVASQRKIVRGRGALTPTPQNDVAIPGHTISYTGHP